MTPTDTGPLVALLDSGDARHTDCAKAVSVLTLPLLTTWLCFTEASYLLGRQGGFPSQQPLWQMRASGQLLVISLSDAEADRTAQRMEIYRDTPMDAADGSLVSIMETLRLNRVFTLDRHFYAYRTVRGDAFELIP